MNLDICQASERCRQIQCMSFYCAPVAVTKLSCFGLNQRNTPTRHAIDDWLGCFSMFSRK
jgi:hypothetical protein